MSRADEARILRGTRCDASGAAQDQASRLTCTAQIQGCCLSLRRQVPKGVDSASGSRRQDRSVVAGSRRAILFQVGGAHRVDQMTARSAFNFTEKDPRKPTALAVGSSGRWTEGFSV